jgi:hypothetical protein
MEASEAYGNTINGNVFISFSKRNNTYLIILPPSPFIQTNPSN